jgi:hypothetical protein
MHQRTFDAGIEIRLALSPARSPLASRAPIQHSVASCANRDRRRATRRNRRSEHFVRETTAVALAHAPPSGPPRRSFCHFDDIPMEWVGVHPLPRPREVVEPDPA